MIKYLAIISAALTAACVAHAPDEMRQQIMALDEVWHASNAPEVERLLARDFERVMPNGEIWDRERQLAWLRARPPGSGFVHRFDSRVITIDGDTAIVTGIATLLNAEGAVVDRNAFTDTYVRSDRQWFLRSARRTPAN